MPRTFYQKTEMWVSPVGGDSIKVEDRPWRSWACRENAIGELHYALFSPATFTAIMPFAPDSIRRNAEMVDGCYSVRTGNDRRSILGTALRNPSCFRMRISLYVYGLTEEDLVKVAQKLQAKYTSVAFSLSFESPGARVFRGDSAPAPCLVLDGDLETVKAWWWSIVLMRLSYNHDWTNVRTLLAETDDEEGLGTASSEDMVDAWNRAIARNEPPGALMLSTCEGPVLSGASLSRDSESYLLQIFAHWRRFAWDLNANRPPRLQPSEESTE